MAARAVTAILVVLLTACSPSVPTVDIQAEPLGDQPTSTEAPTDDATDDPTDEPTDDPTETETAGPRQPTATDRARFVAAFDPPDATGLEHVSVDVDGDGIQELVFAWTHQQRVTRVAIAWWNGSTAYEVAFEADGGEGNSLDTLWVRDVTRDGLTEVVTFQSGPQAQAASATVWQVTGTRQVVALRAVGGCHAGSHTYGAVGVEFTTRGGASEIEATCDDSPLPRHLWSTDRYRWEDGAYRHQPVG